MIIQCTVREFIDEFCDEACESVDIVDKNTVLHFDGYEIDMIPENILDAKVVDHTLCYIPERMSHEVCLYIN